LCAPQERRPPNQFNYFYYFHLSYGNHHPVFFTATIRNWKFLSQPEKYKKIIIDELKTQINKNQIILYCYCLMDNHIHLIWHIKGNVSPSEV
jgi:REP element-mobilizing transposase RayT